MGLYSWMPDHPPEGVDPEDVFYSPETVLAPHRDGGGRAKSICVIGAGIAGLVAAYELLQADHSVTIVEAEHRVGGRVRTWYSGSVNAELGPMRVPRKHHGTMHYLKEMRFRPDRFVQRNANAWLALRGQKVRRAAWQTLLPLYGGAPALFRLPVVAPATPVDDVLKMAEDLAGIDLSGAEAWGVMSGWLGPKAQQLASMTFWEAIMAQWGAVGVSLLTDLGWELVGQATSSIREERISGLEAWIEGAWTFGPEDRVRLVEGMEALPRALRGSIEQLGGNVHLGRRVTAVLTGEPEGVRVRFDDCELDSGERFDYVICAVPAAASSRIDFDPPLAPEKQEALRDISYFSAAKSLVLVNKRRWEFGDGIYGGASYTDRSIQQCWYPSDNAADDPEGLPRGTPGRAGPGSAEIGLDRFVARDPDISHGPAILTAAYMSGTNAERFMSWSAAERDAEVVRHLEFLHPGISADIEGIRHCCWVEQSTPVGGAWTIFEPGKHQRYQDALCAPHPVGVPRVFFAGEHLCVLHGWMQSAIQSSLQAIIDVLKAP